MAWNPGQTLQDGKYILESKLGQGRFAITYLAKDRNGKDLVIKTLDEDKLNQLTPGERNSLTNKFVNEGRRISDLFREGDTHCLVMDFIPGESLWNLVGRTGALPETEAVEYIRQIGLALSVVHQKKLVHLDVTPPNIMVRNNGKAVLIDFGIAADMSPPSTLSRTFGNKAFAPYELRKGERYSTVDIYCLAASLYYAVTAQCPTKSFERKYDGIELKAPKQLVPTISDGLNQAILQGMALEAQDRPQSVQEWLQLLPQQQTDDLSSDKGVDYTKLRDLLAQEKWKEADEESLAVMLKVAGREEESWLRVEDIEEFPCTDLRTIDTLWVKYSKGRFGFSVQKRIWESVGGTPNADDYEIYKRFGDRVKWREDNNWIDLYSDFTFTREAPFGHLPVFGGVGGWGGSWGLWGVVSLLSRRDL
jgi:serine/threonine-protein kinase